MPRRRLLADAERAELLAFPTTDDELIRLYTFSEADLAVIRQRRGGHNRFGFAVQICYLRYPGFALPPDEQPPASLLRLVGEQLRVDPAVWSHYAQRAETRREHLNELLVWLNISKFRLGHYRRFVHQLALLAQQTDRGIVLAAALVEMFRQEHVIMPSLDVIDRICGEALTRGTRHIYIALTSELEARHLLALDGLLVTRTGTKTSVLTWLRQPPGVPKPRYFLRHLERLLAVEKLCLPSYWLNPFTKIVY